MTSMKTTLDLPDDLVREVKIRAVRENRKLKDAITELLRRGLSQKSATGSRVELPLVQCSHAARPGAEITPERVAEILHQEDADAHRGSPR
jgi:plasmid stability protein